MLINSFIRKESPIYMKVKDRNQSSVKTKNAIRTAFAEMVKEKGELDKITVTELVKRANINRSTFYLHYSDIYDIAAELEHSLMSDVMSHNPATKEEMIQFTEALLNQIYKNENLYRQILTSDSPMYFLRKLRREITAKILSIPDVNHTPSPWFQMKVEIFVDGICEQVVYYFRGRTSYSYDELKEGILACTREIL